MGALGYNVQYELKFSCMRRMKIMEMTATQIARELDISRSYLYYLKNQTIITN